MAAIELSFSDHVGLAIVLLKCKPRGIELEDYLSALRLASAATLTDNAEQFDGSKLWYLLFSLTHRKSLDMQAELIASRSIQEDLKLSEAAVTETGRKRKPDTHLPNKANTQSKRRKTKEEALFENMAGAIEVTEHHKDRSLLLRIIFGLARHPQGSPIQPDGLTHLVCLACEAMFEGLENAVDSSIALQASSEQPLLLNEICAAIQQIWTFMTLQLRTASTSISHNVDYNMILPQMCLIIQKLLQRLQNYCLNEALEVVKSTKKDKRMKRLRIASNTNRSVNRTELFEHNCKIVTRCLAHILHKSNDLQVVNEDAFQALAAVFLEHLGSSISFRVFTDPDSHSVQGGILPPRGISDTIDADPRVVAQAAKLASPYLIEILTALMRCRNANSVPMNHFEIVRNLQKSLVRGIFEERTEAKSVHGGFDLDENNQLPASQSTEVVDNDEFLSQVWELLGWDIIVDQAQAGFECSADAQA